jgi:hypothetical protein
LAGSAAGASVKAGARPRDPAEPPGSSALQLHNTPALSVPAGFDLIRAWRRGKIENWEI